MTLVALAAALLITLGFEFVNGFHDTANAVATVIYTRALKPWKAVALSGLFNFIGVMASGVGVAYTVVNLLPVELLVGGRGGEFAVIFAVLLGALIWNLATWYFGIPSSSSHALVGAIIGVGLTHSAVAPGMHFGQGVHWSEASSVGLSLLISPLVGFGLAFMSLTLLRSTIKDPRLYKPVKPDGENKPPSWIRGLLISTCAGVSFAHGSNDGQKGMGLAMLILIGLMPVSFSLDMNADPGRIAAICRSSEAAEHLLVGTTTLANVTSSARLQAYIDNGQLDPDVTPALVAEMATLRTGLGSVQGVRQLPAEQRWGLRVNAMRILRCIDQMRKNGHLTVSTPGYGETMLYRRELGLVVEYVTSWIKLAVALALGLGTMVGWKRVVVTVGEKIGRSGLSYGQGFAAQAVTMGTIMLGDGLGLPVSTTHVLSSGVAGTMLASHVPLQRKTLTNIALAWVLTLPATMALSGFLYLAFRSLI